MGLFSFLPPASRIIRCGWLLVIDTEKNDIGENGRAAIGEVPEKLYREANKIIGDN